MGDEWVITSDNLGNGARLRAVTRLVQPKPQKMRVVRVLTDPVSAVGFRLKKKSKNPSPAFSPAVLRVLACDLLSDTDGPRPSHAEPSSTASSSDYCRDSNYLGTLAVLLCFPGYRHRHVLRGQQACPGRVLSTESRWRGTSRAGTGPKRRCSGAPDRGFSCFLFLCILTIITSGLKGPSKSRSFWQAPIS